MPKQRNTKSRKATAVQQTPSQDVTNEDSHLVESEKQQKSDIQPRTQMDSQAKLPTDTSEHEVQPQSQPETPPATPPEGEQNNHQPSRHVVIEARRVDPEAENRILKDAAERRKQVATKLLQRPDLSDLLQPDSVSEDSDDDVVTELPQVQALNLVTFSDPEKSDNENETEERIIGTVCISSADEDADPVLCKDLDQFKTRKIKSAIKRLRREMDNATERFLKAYDECDRIRAEYTVMASHHERLASNIHMRRVLDVKRHVQ